MINPREAKRRSKEQEQIRADTRTAFGQVATLAPQTSRLINYSSATLGGIIQERTSTNPSFEILLEHVGLGPSDWTHVYFPTWPGNEPNALWLQKGALGKVLEIRFNSKFAAGEVGIKDGLQIAIRPEDAQVLLLQTLKALRDDLLKARTEWAESRRRPRSEFADTLRRLGKSRAVAVDRVLGAFEDRFRREFSVFGLVDEGNRNGREQIARLFTTIPITEDIATAIRRGTQDMSSLKLKEATYSNRLDKGYITFEGFTGIPVSYQTNPRTLTLRYSAVDFRDTRPDFLVTVESMYPTAVRPLDFNAQGEVFHQPEQNPNQILEEHFARTLAGKFPGFYPITVANRGTVLLLKSPNSTPSGVLFDTDFLSKPGDYGPESF